MAMGRPAQHPVKDDLYRLPTGARVVVVQCRGDEASCVYVRPNGSGDEAEVSFASAFLREHARIEYRRRVAASRE